MIEESDSECRREAILSEIRLAAASEKGGWLFIHEPECGCRRMQACDCDLVWFEVERGALVDG